MEKIYFDSFPVLIFLHRLILQGNIFFGAHSPLRSWCQFPVLVAPIFAADPSSKSFILLSPGNLVPCQSPPPTRSSLRSGSSVATASSFSCRTASFSFYRDSISFHLSACYSRSTTWTPCLLPPAVHSLMLYLSIEMLHTFFLFKLGQCHIWGVRELWEKPSLNLSWAP
jgi:hypothetical protein